MHPSFLFFAIFLSAIFNNFSGESGKFPQRIISLGPTITEELYLLGVGDKVVGVTTYCKIPDKSKSKEKVGTVLEFDIEKIIKLKPDLVIATDLTDVKKLEMLKKLGIKVVHFGKAKSFLHICQQFQELGRIVGKEEKAKEIIDWAKKNCEEIEKKTKNWKKKKVFIQIGAKPLFTINKDYFINDFILFAGGENIAENARSGLFSREKVLKLNPDIIIVVGMGIEGKDEKKAWERFKSLKAVKEKKVYILDSDKVCSPTPITFVKTLHEIYEMINF
jgi:iron complex transport system substrate-binding protein